MKLIDLQYTQTPFYGVPRMVQHLRENGHRVNPKRIRRLYREMGLHAIGPRPNTSRPHKGAGHTIFPYLLRGVRVERPNQVWGMDITYVPVGDGHMYLMAIIDLYSRFVVGWSLSNTMTAEWCRECFEMAVSRHGAPEILNTDQGSQFTSSDFTGLLKDNGIRISMDGKGCWRDNVFVERLWKSVKYEEVYLKAYDTVADAKANLGRYLDFYNARRPHQTLDGKTPDTVYVENLPKETFAA